MGFVICQCVGLRSVRSSLCLREARSRRCSGELSAVAVLRWGFDREDAFGFCWMSMRVDGGY